MSAAVLPRRGLLLGLATAPVARCLPALTTNADPVFALIEAHRAARTATKQPPAGIRDDDLDRLLDAEGELLKALLAAQPLTWQAFTTWTVYLHQVIATGDEWDEAAPCLAALARASQWLAGAEVPA